MTNGLADAVEEKAANLGRHAIDRLLDKLEDEIKKMKPGLKKELLSHGVSGMRRITGVLDEGEFADAPESGEETQQ